MLLTVVVLFSLALVKLADNLSEARSQVNKLEQQKDKLDKEIKKLQEENKQLKIVKAQNEAAKNSKPVITAKPPTRVPTATFSGRETIVAAIYAKFGERPQLLTLVQCESGFSPTVISPQGDMGLFQVKASAHPQYPVATLLSVEGNINAAWEISNGGTNWHPWPNCGRTAGLI